MSKETAKKTPVQAKAQAVYEQAPETLKDFESAYIFSSGLATRRDFPKFEPSEIKVGELLGTGGFSDVNEVLNIASNDDDEVHDADVESNKDAEHKADILGSDNNQHYDVSTARAHMSKHTQRLGSARYALKRLKGSLDELEQARGALDLAIEIKLMSAFWHPNIGEWVLQHIDLRTCCISHPSN